MPTVTRLEARARRPDRVNVHLDGAFAFTLGRDLAAGLAIGQVLDDAALARLEAEDGYRRALDLALGQLGRRPRSRRELTDHLARREVPAATVERVLARLAELGLVDDAAFAAWWVENRSQHRPRGTQALRQELGRRGIAPADRAAATAGLDEAALARELALAQAGRYRGQPWPVFARRLGGLLARRGFGAEAVRPAVAAAWEALGGSPLPAGEDVEPF